MKNFMLCVRGWLFASLALTAPVMADSHLTDDEQVEAVHRGTEIIEGASGVPIAVTRAGDPDGRGIIFLHSILASSLNFTKQLDSTLGDDFNLAAMDMRGHGASGKPWDPDAYLDPAAWAGDIAAVSAAAGMEKPVLVAWSFGGLFAMDFVRTYGTEALGGIVFVGSNGGFIVRPPGEETLTRRLQVARNTSQNIGVIYEWTQGYMNFLVQDGPDAEAEKAMFTAASLMTPHYVRPNFRLRNSDNTDLIDALDVPVLFLVGAKDVVNRAEDIQGVADQIPGAELRIYDNSASMPFWYEAEAFNADIAAFVNGLP